MNDYSVKCVKCGEDSVVTANDVPNFCALCGSNEIVLKHVNGVEMKQCELKRWKAPVNEDGTSQVLERQQEPVECVASAPAPEVDKCEAPRETDVAERESFNCGPAEDWGSIKQGIGLVFSYEVPNAPAQGSQEWLRWRSEGITATEAAVIMFPDQYKSALTVYNQKVGIAPPDDQSDPDGFFEWGHILEDDLVRKFKTLHPELAGTVTQGRLYQRNWAKCSLDAQCVLADGTPCIIECKSSQSASKWNPYPEKYFAQVQWQMYVTGIRKAIIIAVICEGGYHYIEREVEYSPKFVEEMLYKCLDIYRCVQFKKVPEISVLGNPESDKKAIAQLAGESDRSGEDATITREEYEEYERLKEAAEKATEAFENFKNQLAYKMMDSPRTTCEGKKFASWVERKGSIKVDAKKLKEFYPEVYDAVTSEGLPSRYIKYNKLNFD